MGGHDEMLAEVTLAATRLADASVKAIERADQQNRTLVRVVAIGMGILALMACVMAYMNYSTVCVVLDMMGGVK